MGEGAPSRQSFAQVIDWNVGKGVQIQPAASPAILAQFTMGLDPFKAMAMSIAIAKHLRRRQG